MNSINNEIEIKKIYLMMGSACNFSCRYCLQQPIKQDISNKPISLDVYKYIDKIQNLKQQNNKQPLSIIFWGGEPLLYWKTIKEFVLHYKRQLSYGIISNGSLLTQEIVDFMNEYHIRFILSHDGVNTTVTRNIDVLQNKNFVNLFRKVHYKGLNATLSAANLNYNDLFDYWDQYKFECSGNIEMFRVTWDMPKDLRNIDLNAYRKGLQELFKESLKICKAQEFSYKAVYAINLIQRAVIRRRDKKFHFPKCYKLEHIVDIDLDGNIYVCHNSSMRIGHVNENRKIYLDKFKQWIKHYEKEECNTCEAKYYCQGGCPLEIDTDSCKLQKALYEEAIIAYENNKKDWDSFFVDEDLL